MSDARSSHAAAKASSPLQIQSQTWRYVWRRTLQEFVHDGCVDAAGSLTFFAVLSIFPAGLALVALIGVVGDSEAVVTRLLTLLDQVAPPEVTETLESPLLEIAGASTAELTLFIAVPTAVWSASLYVGAFGRTLNRIHDVAEGRPYWKRKPAQLGVTIALMILALVVIGVIVISRPVARAIGDALAIGDAALSAWDILKWPLLACSVAAMVTVLYKGTSNLRQPPARWLAIGAVLAIVLLGVSSTGLFVYLSGFADYNRTFGAFASVIVFLIWVFMINMALLFGAEFNAELERGRQLQAGQRAEVRIQLDPRDTTLSEHTARAAEITRHRGELLRTGETLPPREDSVVSRVARFVREGWRRLNRRD